MEKDIKISSEGFNKHSYQKYVLVADIGGHHTYVAIMGVKEKKEFDVIFKYSLLTRDIDSINIPLNEALKNAHEIYGIEVDTACFGIAGPVEDHLRKHMKLTHWDLTIKVEDIHLNTLLKHVILLNDFEAVGYGIDFLKEDKDMVSISHPNFNLPHRKKESTVCVIGAGYGLGTSILAYDKTKSMHVPLACEAGHIDFVPENDFDVDFQNFLKNEIIKNKMKIPDSERYVSGRGIIDLWHFIRKRNLYGETEIAKNIDFLMNDDKLNSIFVNYHNDHTCKKTIDMFIKYYAQFARNMALVSVCYGGLYIGGGIAPRHVELFSSSIFIREFEKSDKKSDILAKIPVYIITNHDIGLYGCCNVAVNFADRF